MQLVFSSEDQGRRRHHARGLVTVDVTCLAYGTLIETPGGAVANKDLRPGDPVLTRDHGAQPLRRVGSSPVDAGTLASARFSPEGQRTQPALCGALHEMRSRSLALPVGRRRALLRPTCPMQE